MQAPNNIDIGIGNCIDIGTGTDTCIGIGIGTCIGIGSCICICTGNCICICTGTWLGRGLYYALNGLAQLPQDCKTARFLQESQE